MRKLALVLATAATLAVTVVATTSSAHARYYGYGPGIFGGLLAGALIAGIASSAYGYGPGYGYFGGYYPAYYGGYHPAYYGGYYHRILRRPRVQAALLRLQTRLRAQIRLLWRSSSLRWLASRLASLIILRSLRRIRSSATIVPDQHASSR